MYRISDTSLDTFVYDFTIHNRILMREPRSGLTNDYEFGICCFSAKHAALRRNSKGSESG